VLKTLCARSIITFVQKSLAYTYRVDGIRTTVEILQKWCQEHVLCRILQIGPLARPYRVCTKLVSVLEVGECVIPATSIDQVHDIDPWAVVQFKKRTIDNVVDLFSGYSTHFLVHFEGLSFAQNDALHPILLVESKTPPQKVPYKQVFDSVKPSLASGRLWQS
jgi:hypothetical protein